MSKEPGDVEFDDIHGTYRITCSETQMMWIEECLMEKIKELSERMDDQFLESNQMKGHLRLEEITFLSGSISEMARIVWQAQWLREQQFRDQTEGDEDVDVSDS